jgi:hypothetical protein
MFAKISYNRAQIQNLMDDYADKSIDDITQIRVMYNVKPLKKYKNYKVRCFSCLDYNNEYYTWKFEYKIRICEECNDCSLYDSFGFRIIIIYKFFVIANLPVRTDVSRKIAETFFAIMR